jgi:hypothetical protein
MKTSLLRSGLVALCSLCLSTAAFAQTPAPKIDFPQASPLAGVSQRVGLTDIQVTYHRPSAKGRTVFGSLVPYDHVWRTGANDATKISFSTPVKLNGTDVPAGTYELFTIPGKTEWTVIIHKNMSQWGAYSYDAKNDVARVTAKPVALTNGVETLAISFNDLRDESATLSIAWEKVRVPVTVTVDVKSTLVPQIETVMASGGAKLPYFNAAMYYFENGIDLNKALAWMDAAIAANPEAFYMVYRKALIQEKMGDKAGAIATAKLSIEGANKASGAVKEEYLGLNEALIKRLQ